MIGLNGAQIGSLLVEGDGLPVGLVVDGAHVHDAVLAEDMFVGVPVKRSKLDAGSVLRFEAEKGYDCLEVRYLVGCCGVVAHISRNRRNAKHFKEQTSLSTIALGT